MSQLHLNCFNSKINTTAARNNPILQIIKKLWNSLKSNCMIFGVSVVVRAKPK